MAEWGQRRCPHKAAIDVDGRRPAALESRLRKNPAAPPNLPRPVLRQPPAARCFVVSGPWAASGVQLVLRPTSDSDAHVAYSLCIQITGETDMSAPFRRHGPTHGVGTGGTLLALDCAQNVHAAVDRRTPEARALTGWLTENAAAFGLGDAALPEDGDGLGRSRRRGVPVADWRKVKAALDVGCGGPAQPGRCADQSLDRGDQRRAGARPGVHAHPGARLALQAGQAGRAAVRRDQRVPRRRPQAEPGRRAVRAPAAEPRRPRSQRG